MITIIATQFEIVVVERMIQFVLKPTESIIQNKFKAHKMHGVYKNR